MESKKTQPTRARRRRLNGVVAAIKMDKTAVVLVERQKLHPVYQKRYTVSKKYLVHDEGNVAKVGDKVTIEESKPVSKRKRFRLVTQKA